MEIPEMFLDPALDPIKASASLHGPFPAYWELPICYPCDVCGMRGRYVDKIPNDGGILVGEHAAFAPTLHHRDFIYYYGLS
jgi:hypothetical protein